MIDRLVGYVAESVSGLFIGSLVCLSLFNYFIYLPHELNPSCGHKVQKNSPWMKNVTSTVGIQVVLLLLQ